MAPRWLLTLLAFLLLAVCATAGAAPKVTQTPDGLVVTTQHFTATFSRPSGGLLASLTTRDGHSLLGGSTVYTDNGPYGAGVYLGTMKATAQLTTETRGEQVIVRAEGTLASREGVLPTKPGTIRYQVEYTFGDGPQIGLAWSAVPSFNAPDTAGFMAHLLSVVDIAGVAANTAEGVLLQDPQDHSTRSYQAYSMPLDEKRPWVGVLRTDGRWLLFTDPQSTPPFVNVFLHEQGNGTAAMFFAWLDGTQTRSLEAGKPWKASCTVRLLHSLEELGDAGD
ncbi:hypothetical protein LLH03_02545 [bacterium]|nr:hypothetical protein [bacterium]